MELADSDVLCDVSLCSPFLPDYFFPSHTEGGNLVTVSIPSNDLHCLMEIRLCILAPSLHVSSAAYGGSSPKGDAS